MKGTPPNSPWEGTWDQGPGVTPGKGPGTRDRGPVSQGTPPIPEQTHTCENMTSRRTTYADGKNKTQNNATNEGSTTRLQLIYVNFSIADY